MVAKAPLHQPESVTSRAAQEGFEAFTSYEGRELTTEEEVNDLLAELKERLLAQLICRPPATDKRIASRPGRLCAC